MKKRIFSLLLAVLCAGMMLASQSAAQHFARWYPAMGLRFVQPLTGQQVLQVQGYCADQAALAEEKRQVSLCPSFWKQTSEIAFSACAQANVTAVGCLGEFSTVWQADFVSGGAPGQLETGACALSDTAAWQLFGSDDLVGLNVRLGLESYRITGVFSDKQAVLIYTAPSDAGFTAVELSGKFETDMTAEHFAQTAGLGAPSSVLYGPDMGHLAFLVALVPLLAAGAALCVLLVRWCFSHVHAPYRRVFLFALALLLAVLLPVFLGMLPGWMIPPQWSDFAFWGRLAQEGKAQLRAWLSLSPCEKDIEAKIALIKLVLSGAVSLLLEGICEKYWPFLRKSSTS